MSSPSSNANPGIELKPRELARARREIERLAGAINIPTATSETYQVDGGDEGSKAGQVEDDSAQAQAELREDFEVVMKEGETQILLDIPLSLVSVMKHSVVVTCKDLPGLSSIRNEA